MSELKSQTGAADTRSKAWFDAQIAKRGRPVYTKDERKAIGREVARREAQNAAEKDRQVAAALLKRADQYDAQAAKLGGHS
jgi:hypothetical protein